jgi:hypothetical protein
MKFLWHREGIMSPQTFWQCGSVWRVWLQTSHTLSHGWTFPDVHEKLCRKNHVEIEGMNHWELQYAGGWTIAELLLRFASVTSNSVRASFSHTVVCTCRHVFAAPVSYYRRFPPSSRSLFHLSTLTAEYTTVFLSNLRLEP